MRCVAVAVLVIFGFGCGVNVYDRNEDADVVSYSVNYDARTPSGIAVDSSGQQVSMQDIDARVDAVITCLAAKYPQGLPADTMKASSCLYSNILVDRASLGVKVAPDWHVTAPECSDVAWGGAMQVFPCTIDKALCDAKHLNLDPSCPCECRSAVLDNHVIVTTPDLYLFDDALIRVLTSCNDIWTTELASCFQG
jgi:hypothetical protein